MKHIENSLQDISQLCYYPNVNLNLTYLNMKVTTVYRYPNSEFASRMESRASGGKAQDRKKATVETSITDIGAEDKNDGSISDSAVSSGVTERRKRQPTIGYKVAALVGLSRKSTSTSQIGGEYIFSNHFESSRVQQPKNFTLGFSIKSI